MNLVYLLTNLNKTEGKRYYVGSKQEATVQKIDGIYRVIDRNGLIYHSSSSSVEFANDMKDKNVFEACLLEEVPDKKILLEREKYYINKYNAILSDDFYNISGAVLNCHNQDIIINTFGQSFREVSSDKSSVSKRDNNAKKFGYDNFGVMAFDLYEKHLYLQNWRAVSDLFDGMPRYTPGRVVKPYNMEKAKEELKNDLTSDIRLMYIKGATLQYIANVLNIELPSARVFLGEYGGKNLKTFITARNIGFTKLELEVAIAKRFLDGEGFNKIARDFKIDATSCKRYCYNCIREKLKSSDL